jgi:hypothetical protein
VLPLVFPSCSRTRHLRRVRLPVNLETDRGVILGEGKPENQNHAIIFCHTYVRVCGEQQQQPPCLLHMVVVAAAAAAAAAVLLSVSAVLHHLSGSSVAGVMFQGLRLFYCLLRLVWFFLQGGCADD